MLSIPCPWCGPRNSSEFGYSGEVAARPDPVAATPLQWRGYLYLRDNRADWTTERWFHRHGCRRYFVVERHLTTHEIRVGSTASQERP
ncbi:MAG: sarcosine oxidase subunit delta [Stackebrandtia sp.]